MIGAEEVVAAEEETAGAAEEGEAEAAEGEAAAEVVVLTGELDLRSRRFLVVYAEVGLL